MTRIIPSLILALGAALACTAAPADASVIVQDNFNRSDSETVGTTSDGTDTWSESEGGGGDDRVEILNNAARIAYNGSYANPGMSLTDLRLADGIITADIDIVSSTSLNRLHGINYRASSNFNARYYESGNTFHVLVKSQWDGDEDVELRYGSTVLATGDISDDVSDSPFTLRVEFEGSSHKVYVDDTLMIDYTDPSNRNDSGSIGLGTYIGAMDVDNFTVSEIPEPASVALLGLGGLMMLGRRRRA